MKKSALYIILISMLFTSCQFLQPGFWQEKIEEASSKKSVASIPSVEDTYKNWTEISVSEAESIWETSAFKNNIKNPPAAVTAYQKEEVGSYCYSNCTVEKFPNYLYSKDVCNSIYVIGFSSLYLDGSTIALNYYTPYNLPEGAKLYKSDDSSAVKFVLTKKTSAGSNCKMTVIYKNGLLIMQDFVVKTVIVY